MTTADTPVTAETLQWTERCSESPRAEGVGSARIHRALHPKVIRARQVLTYTSYDTGRKLFGTVTALTTTSTAELGCAQSLWPLLASGRQLTSIPYYVSGNENLEIFVSSPQACSEMTLADTLVTAETLQWTERCSESPRAKGVGSARIHRALHPKAIRARQVLTYTSYDTARKLFGTVTALTTTSTAELGCAQLLWPLLTRGRQLWSIPYYVSGNENLEILVSRPQACLTHWVIQLGCHHIMQKAGISVILFFFHIRTVHLDIIKVSLFTNWCTSVLS